MKAVPGTVTFKASDPYNTVFIQGDFSSELIRMNHVCGTIFKAEIYDLNCLQDHNYGFSFGGALYLAGDDRPRSKLPPTEV